VPASSGCCTALVAAELLAQGRVASESRGGCRALPWSRLRVASKRQTSRAVFGYISCTCGVP
jgi:hypothetical protein